MHWNAREAAERAALVRRAGHRVLVHSETSADGLRDLRDDPPDAVVIDLSRIPSHGRAVGVFLRQQKATREKPLVFVDGDPEKTTKTKALLPDAVYTTWPRIGAALAKSLRQKPRQLAVPGTMAGYSGTPLPKELGIRPGARVAFAGAPAGFEKALGELPEGARTTRAAAGPVDVLLLFVRTQAELARRFPTAARRVADGGKLWLCWPKQASGEARDLGEAAVRAFGLARMWVDYKICAVDQTWSGLCFARRRETA